VCWSAYVELLDDLHSLVEERELLLLNFFEDSDSGLRVNELHAVHFVQESLNRVLLFQLLEPDHGLLPIVIVDLELLFVFNHDIIVEDIAFNVLLGVLQLVTFFEINHNLIDHRLKLKRNVDQLISELVEEPSATL